MLLFRKQTFLHVVQRLETQDNMDVFTIEKLREFRC